MTIFCIHYHKDTGRIRNWGSDDGSTESFAGPDYAIAHFDEWYAVDPMLDKIDPTSGNIIDLSDAERRDDQHQAERQAEDAERHQAEALRELLRKYPDDATDL
jgi:hypothetical protein